MYKKILIATDGSELAGKGLDHGLKFAKALNVPVTVVTSTETWSTLEMAYEAERSNPDPIGEFEKAAATHAKKVLERAKDAAKKLGVSCDTIHVVDRHPAEGILHTAKSKGCDLIVMASHGHRGVKKALLGSVASEVLGDSKLPVLIVR